METLDLIRELLNGNGTVAFTSLKASLYTIVDAISKGYITMQNGMVTLADAGKYVWHNGLPR